MKILSAIEKDIRELIGYRWPRATEFLDENFHPLMVDLEEKSKAAVYGNFSKEFPNLFKKLLESCYTFIKIIRSHFESNTVHSKHSGVLISPGANSQLDYENMACDPKQKGNQLKRTKTTQPQAMVRRTSKNQPQLHAVSPVTTPVASPVLKWRCFKCTFVNHKGDKCNMCGESKPIMYEMVSSPTSTVKKTEDSRVKKWICTCCKFINASTNSECQMCRQPNTLNQNSWICPYCSASNMNNTNINTTAVIKCSNCDKSKPRGRSVSSPHLEKNPSFIGPPNILNNITNHHSMVQRTKSNASRKKIIPFSQATISLKNNYY